MDPVTTVLLVVAALIGLVVFSWVWQLFGDFFKIIIIFAVLGLIISFVQKPKETEEYVLGAVHNTVEFAHKIGDELKPR